MKGLQNSMHCNQFRGFADNDDPQLQTMQDKAMQEIFTTIEVSVLLKCEEKTVEDLLRRGALPGVKIGRSWIIPEEALSLRLNEMALANSGSGKSRPPILGAIVNGVARQSRRRSPPILPKLDDLIKG